MTVNKDNLKPGDIFLTGEGGEYLRVNSDGGLVRYYASGRVESRGDNPIDYAKAQPAMVVKMTPGLLALLCEDGFITQAEHRVARNTFDRLTEPPKPKRPTLPTEPFSEVVLDGGIVAIRDWSGVWRYATGMMSTLPVAEHVKYVRRVGLNGPTLDGGTDE